jgi:hypothetical protein
MMSEHEVIKDSLSGEELIAISLGEYKELLKMKSELSALHSLGVQDWENYSFVQELMLKGEERHD